MPEPLLHDKTKLTLKSLLAAPPQAILIVGKTGAGKQTIAMYFASRLLQVELTKLENHPFFMLRGDGDSSISIDTVRDIQHFVSRKATSNDQLSRVMTVVNADRLTNEAQNAFLKTLEEPPAGTVIIMTVSDKQKLLPTILSRLQSVEITTPDIALTRLHFESAGYTTDTINKAVLMSGGLPGLMTSLLAGEQDHPLVKAADTARNILRLDTFGRIALIDTISKQRQQCLDTCFILQQMAELSLQGSAKTANAYKQWRTILSQAYEAEQALLAQAQPKLVLTNLMLSI